MLRARRSCPTMPPEDSPTQCTRSMPSLSISPMASPASWENDILAARRRLGGLAAAARVEPQHAIVGGEQRHPRPPEQHVARVAVVEQEASPAASRATARCSRRDRSGCRGRRRAHCGTAWRALAAVSSCTRAAASRCEVRGLPSTRERSCSQVKRTLGQCHLTMPWYFCDDSPADGSPAVAAVVPSPYCTCPSVPDSLRRYLRRRDDLLPLGNLRLEHGREFLGPALRRVDGLVRAGAPSGRRRPALSRFPRPASRSPRAAWRPARACRTRRSRRSRRCRPRPSVGTSGQERAARASRRPRSRAACPA